MKRMKYISKWVGIKRRIKVGPVLIRIRSVLGIAYSLIKETLSIAGLDPTDTVEFGDFFLNSSFLNSTKMVHSTNGNQQDDDLIG